MAELVRSHVLESRVPALAAAGITVEPFVAMVNVRSSSGLRPNTWEPIDGGREIWLGLDERLLTSAGEAPWDFEARVGGTDVSAQRITLRLSGDSARRVLAKGCSLDLHVSRFPAGSCAQTRLGQAGVILLALRDGFLVLVRTSFAGYLADWLLDASAEFR